MNGGGRTVTAPEGFGRAALRLAGMLGPSYTPGMRVSDPLEWKAAADEAVDRTAAELRKLLQEAAAELDPFPAFPGAFFTNAIEAEPAGAASTERGCIVVCADGELYELQIGVDLDSVALDGFEDPVSLRKEELHPLDLHPRDYIVFAYNALSAVTEQLMVRAEAERS
jgi:hypothetical protein